MLSCKNAHTSAGAQPQPFVILSKFDSLPTWMAMPIMRPRVMRIMVGAMPSALLSGSTSLSFGTWSLSDFCQSWPSSSTLA